MPLRKKSKITRKTQPRITMGSYPFLKRQRIRVSEVYIDAMAQVRDKSPVSLRIEKPTYLPGIQHVIHVGIFLGRFISSDKVFVTHKYNDQTGDYEKIENPYYLERTKELRFFIDPIHIRKRKGDRE